MDLLPARMLNEYAYCPRLYALEHLCGEWVDSADTVEGRTVHRRVDEPTTAGLPEPEADPDRPRVVRQVKLGDPALGLLAVIDLVEAEDGMVVPVDYKKGKLPDAPEGAWEPERVQVGAQVLLLRAHGYACDHGVLYFAGSKRRVKVIVDAAFEARVLQLRDEALALAAGGPLPPPLIDSPKCRGCSLVGICLPDEHNLALGLATTPRARPLVPARDDRVPMHVQARGAKATLDHGEIVVADKEKELGRARLNDTSSLALYGAVAVTTPLLHALADADIPVSLHSFGGWYVGSFVPASGANVFMRTAQHRKAADASAALAIAKEMVRAKIANQRVLLRRNGRELPEGVLPLFEDALEQAMKAPDADTLRGYEGYAAKLYFQHFPRMLSGELGSAFDFEGRNRRPPMDPVNALLSFAYACLTRECTTALHRVGLDPYVGFLHTIRPGRPALALDLMEEFRPIIADSAVVTAVNTGVVQEADFLRHPTGTSLRDAARKRFVHVIERRLDELVTHPAYGSTFSYRRILEIQARMLGKALLDEIPAYPGFRVR